MGIAYIWNQTNADHQGKNCDDLKCFSKESFGSIFILSVSVKKVKQCFALIDFPHQLQSKDICLRKCTLNIKNIYCAAFLIRDGALMSQKNNAFFAKWYLAH